MMTHSQLVTIAERVQLCAGCGGLCVLNDRSGFVKVNAAALVLSKRVPVCTQLNALTSPPRKVAARSVFYLC